MNMECTVGERISVLPDRVRLQSHRLRLHTGYILAVIHSYSREEPQREVYE